jgi:hypothetical protein
MIIGKTMGESLSITRAELIEAVGGLPSRKHHAASLAIEALGTVLRKLSESE